MNHARVDFHIFSFAMHSDSKTSSNCQSLYSTFCQIPLASKFEVKTCQTLQLGMITLTGVTGALYFASEWSNIHIPSLMLICCFHLLR